MEKDMVDLSIYLAVENIFRVVPLGNIPES